MVSTAQLFRFFADLSDKLEDFHRLTFFHRLITRHLTRSCRDTAGQERFRTITTAYYRGAMGIMLVYDITDEKSFENIKNWIRNIEENASANVEKMLLGNKCELNEKRQVIMRQFEWPATTVWPAMTSLRAWNWHVAWTDRCVCVRARVCALAGDERARRKVGSGVRHQVCRNVSQSQHQCGGGLLHPGQWH